MLSQFAVCVVFSRLSIGDIGFAELSNENSPEPASTCKLDAEISGRCFEETGSLRIMESASAGPSDPVECLYFPHAAQSDILRAAQKDEICLRALESSIRDVVHGYLGSASLHKYGGAIRALATTAYYATSIGAKQSLPKCGPLHAR